MRDKMQESTNLRTLVSVTRAPTEDLRATTVSPRLSLVAERVSASVGPAKTTYGSAETHRRRLRMSTHLPALFSDVFDALEDVQSYRQGHG